MIKFSSSGADVKIVVDSGVSKFTFTHHCGQDYLAGLMRDQYEKHMNSVRRKAYDQGWKDAKAKRKRETWFSGWWS